MGFSAQKTQRKNELKGYIKDAFKYFSFRGQFPILEYSRNQADEDANLERMCDKLAIAFVDVMEPWITSNKKKVVVTSAGQAIPTFQPQPQGGSIVTAQETVEGGLDF